MSTLSEYGDFGAVEVEVEDVLEDDDDEDAAPSASWRLGKTVREIIRTKISNDRDFIKTLQADNLRY